MTEPIATIYNYEIGLTADLTDEEISELGELLGKFAEKIRPDEKYRTSVVWGYRGKTPVKDFAPDTLMRLKEDR